MAKKREFPVSNSCVCMIDHANKEAQMGKKKKVVSRFETKTQKRLK
jgi:hypothetical protein